MLAVKPSPTHVLHLLLSLVTVGMWLPVWLVVAFAADKSPALCPRCGARTLTRDRPPQWIWQRWKRAR